MFKEFKKFIARGNVIDLAVGIIIGGAFGKIVSSLVNDIVMPLVSMLLSKTNFKDLSIVLKKGTETTEPVLLNYGNFIQNVVDFLIISFVIFLMIKAINKVNFKKEQEAKEEVKPVISKEEQLLTEIRDLLKK